MKLKAKLSRDGATGAWGDCSPTILLSPPLAPKLSCTVGIFITSMAFHLLVFKPMRLVLITCTSHPGGEPLVPQVCTKVEVWCTHEV